VLRLAGGCLMSCCRATMGHRLPAPLIRLPEGKSKEVDPHRVNLRARRPNAVPAIDVDPEECWIAELQEARGEFRRLPRGDSRVVQAHTDQEGGDLPRVMVNECA
jgi:hypothetical protein